MKFTKTNIESPKGRQPSSVDFLIDEFTNPGDSLQFNERTLDNKDGMTRQKASNIAKRLMFLSGKQFHSFFDVSTQKVTIRLRKDGEIPTEEEVEAESTHEPEENSTSFGLE